MRRNALKLTLSAGALLLAVACVPNSEVPSVVQPPGQAPSGGAGALIADPDALTLSASAVQPPYATITVSQPATNAAPTILASQSTCLTNGNVAVMNTTTAGSSTTFELLAITPGQCVLEFGGLQGVILIVPVTVTS
ncbi:MAG: hypothetical protein ACRENA_16815 [Vulcanimicrobiaceae bacterium]